MPVDMITLSMEWQIHNGKEQAWDTKKKSIEEDSEQQWMRDEKWSWISTLP